MKKLTLNLFALLVILSLSTCKKGSSNNEDESQVTETELNAQVLTQQLSYPWEILWGPDGQLWLTERGGKISRVNPSSGQITPVITIADVRSVGEGGLLGMAMHPDFAANPQVFVAYNYNKNNTLPKRLCATLTMVAH